MAYYDLNIEVPDAEEAVKMAKRLGYSGISIANPQTMPFQAAVKEGIDLVSSVMIIAKTKEELFEEIEKHRNSAEIIMVCGGDYEINRAACEDSRVDILCHPEKNRADSGIDHICAKAAAENGVMIEINFNEILNSRNRPRQIYFMQRNVYLCKEYKAKTITTSGAKTVWEMRAPREMASVANILGLKIDEAIETVSSVPEEKIITNREKLKGSRFGDVKVIE